MAWKNYQPWNNDELHTLWELARQFVDQYRQEYPFDGTPDEDYIRKSGIQYLIRWLFSSNGQKGFVNFELPQWDMFIKRFTVHFLNIEISYFDPRLFRTKLIEFVMNNKSFMEESVTKIFDEIKTADAKITNTHTSSGSSNSSGSSMSSNESSSESNRNDEGSSASDYSSDFQSDGTNDYSSTGESETTSEDTSKGSNSSQNSSKSFNRRMESDMPHSLVNQDAVGSPELQTWKYASAMADTNENTEGDNTTETSNSNTTKGNGSDTTTSKTTDNRVNSETRVEKRSDMRKGSDTKKDTSTNTEEDTKHTTDTSNSEDQLEILNPFHLSKERYEFFIEHLEDPIQELVNRASVLFMCDYIHEKRMGFLDWNDVDNITSKLYDKEETV